MIEIDKEDVAKRIAIIRKTLNLTMKDFGERIDGVDKSTISNWEKGKTMPSNYHLELIAKEGNRDISWLQYGELEEYLPKLIDRLRKVENVKRIVDFDLITGEKYNELLKILKYNKIEPGEVKRIVDNIFVMFRKEVPTKDSVEHKNPFDTEIEDELPGVIQEYDILKNQHFYNVYLETLNSLLLNDEKRLENDQILLFIMDTLTRMNPNAKSQLLEVIKDISWMSTNNIFMLNKRDQSEYAKYGGVRFGAYDRQYDRTKEEIDKEFNEILNNINENLVKILDGNYKEFKKRDFKSIF